MIIPYYNDRNHINVLAVAVIGFPSGHESESEHGHEGTSDSGGKYKLFGLLFLGIAAIAVIPIFNLQLLSWVSQIARYKFYINFMLVENEENRGIFET
jgi:hypothetical protein